MRDFKDMFNDGIGGIICGILLLIVTLFIVGLTSIGILYLIDSSYLPEKKATGEITNMYIVPGHYTHTSIMCGKTSIPVTTWHDTTYNLTIAIDGISDDVSITGEYYLLRDIGDKVKCTYTNGRMFDSLYIKSINNDSW